MYITLCFAVELVFEVAFHADSQTCRLNFQSGSREDCASKNWCRSHSASLLVRSSTLRHCPPSDIVHSASLVDSPGVKARSRCATQRSASFLESTQLIEDTKICSSPSSSGSSDSSFALQPRASRKTAFPAFVFPQAANVFNVFCECVVAESFKEHVGHLFDEYTHSTKLHSNSFGWKAEELRRMVEGAVLYVDALQAFLDTINTHARQCFPAEFQVLGLAYTAVQDALQKVMFDAVEDRHKIWTYKGYMDLVLAIRRLIDHCRTFEMHVDFVNNVDGDLRVRTTAVAGYINDGLHFTIRLCSMRDKWEQVVYTSIGNLAHQFLMLSIDGATRESALAMSIDGQDSMASLPDCIELLRMMHQQVNWVSALTTAPTLGCR